MQTIASAAARLFAALLLLAAGAAQAQPYPSRPVRIVVPYAAGGPADVLARTVGERLGERLQQRVVVENITGGNATIGILHVAKSAPDGYTFLIAAPAFTVNPSLMKSATYDPVKDFAPVSMLMDQPMFVVVHPSVPANTIEELIALLKANPTKYNYGTSGAGGPQHLLGEMFKAATGTQVTHVPYRGAAPAGVAILAGETQISFSTPTNTFPFVKSGKLRVLAATTLKRSEFAPDVPTLNERVIKGFNYTSWTGLIAPAGTPKEILQRISQEAAAIVQEKATKDKLFAQGISSVGSSPEEFAAFIRSDVAASVKLIKDIGLQPE